MTQLKRSTILWGAVGILAGFGAGLGLRACAQQPASPTPPTPMTTGSEADDGRYRVVIGPAAPADVYLVDTQTGATWQRTKDPKSQQDIFIAVRVQPAMPPAPFMIPPRARP